MREPRVDVSKDVSGFGFDSASRNKSASRGRFTASRVAATLLSASASFGFRSRYRLKISSARG